MSESQENIVLLHKTLLEEQCIFTAVATKDKNNNTTLLVIAQGSNLITIDPKDFTIIDRYPLMSPIIGLVAVSPISTEKPSVFVVLRNLSWFIFTFPDIVCAGSFGPSHAQQSHRMIAPTASQTATGSTCQNPVSTSALRFVENRIPIAVHPCFIAVHAVSNLIHIIPTKEMGRPPILIRVNQPNIVDIAFIGPVGPSFNTRLAVISDPEFNRNDTQSTNDHRVLVVYNMQRNGSEFTKEFSLDIRPDAHTILPLSVDLASVAIVFTFDGVIRITCPEGLQPTTEHITVFLEGMTLMCEKIYGDDYYLVDAGGGLCAGRFPVQDRPTTSKLKNVGPVSSIVAIDSRRVLITSPFGDANAYELHVSSRDDEVATLSLIHTIETSGYIANITATSHDNIKMLTGRGETSKIKNFHLSIKSDEMARVSVPGCVNIFSAPAENDNVIICCSFLNASRLLMTDGSNFDNFELCDFISDEPTLYFCKAENGFLQVTVHRAAILYPDAPALIHPYEDQILFATVSDGNLLHSTDKSITRILRLKGLEPIKKYAKEKEQQIVAIGVSKFHMCEYFVDNTLIVASFRNRNLDQEIIPLDNDFISSIAIVDNDSDDYTIYIGTLSGNLISISNKMEERNTEHISDSPVVLKQTDNGIFIAGSPPFKLTSSGRQSIDCNDCSDITSSENILCVLSGNDIQVYKATDGRHGISKFDKNAKNAVNAIFVDNKVFILEESKSGDQIVSVYEGKTFVTATAPETHRISLFTKISIFDQDYIVIGTDNNVVKFLDFSLNTVCTTKTVAIPTSICFVNEVVAIGEGSQISLYIPQLLQGRIELDRTCVKQVHVLISSLISYNNILIAGDALRSIQTYSVSSDALEDIQVDSYAKEVRSICIFKGIAFASTFNSSLYAFFLNEDGSFDEIGSMRTDSNITGFTVDEDSLYYSTERGGVFRISLSHNEKLQSLRDCLDQEELTLVHKRDVSESVPFLQADPFVDMDNLAVITKLTSKKEQKLLKNSGLTKAELMSILSEKEN